MISRLEFNAGLNAHVNIIEEAGKRNQIAKVRGNSRYIWVENDLDYPRKEAEQFEAERDPQRAFSAVEKYGLEGVIYGAEHAFRYDADPAKKFWDFVDFTRGRIADDVRFCLDLDPLQMRKLSPDAQLGYINGLVQRLEKAA